MTRTHWLLLLAFAVVALFSGCAWEIDTPYGRLASNGKTLKVILLEP